MHNQKVIFIHVPKTGGTSLNCSIEGTEWQTKPDYFYRHLIYETKRPNCGDIFDSNKNDQYFNHPIFFFVRDPIDRLFSEYYFLRNRKEFMSLLPRKPRDFFEYCRFGETTNSMIKFLIGEKIFSNRKITQELFEDLIAQIEKLDIGIGIFDRYADSLSYLSDHLNYNWAETIDIKRITIDKPSQVELLDAKKEQIIELNHFDYALYNFAIEKLEAASFTNKDIQFRGNKYDYVLKYTQRFIIIESIITCKELFTENKSYFNSLNLMLHKQVNNGFDYMTNWNKLFIDSFIRTYGDSKIEEEIHLLKTDDPLDKIFEVAKIISNYYPKLPYKIRSRKMSHI